MPYQGEHACRLIEPDACQNESFRRVNNDRSHEGKNYHVIYAKRRSDGSWADQSYRYPTEEWSEAKAKEHCQEHDGLMFEPASQETGKEIFMALTHSDQTADSEPAWGKVDQTRLPRNAFADMGDPRKKSTWKYPHHWVRNGGMGEDDYGNEVYVSGYMFLHDGGLDAAWAAAQGARSGEKASQKIRNHLQKHRRALNKTEDEEDEDAYLSQRSGINIAGLLRGPWAITKEGMANVQAKADYTYKVLLTQEGINPQDAEITTVRGDVAIIEVIGPIFHYSNILTWIFGLPAAELVAQEYRKALDNPEVNKIIFWIDSPGGQLGGISELAQQIAKGKQKKTTVAYVGDIGASAAYWIASSASEIVAVDTALVGSIGAVMGIMVRDDEDGILEIVSSQSPRKRPDPRTEEGLQQLQDRIDALSEVFIKAVMDYREMSREAVTSLEGDVAIAAKAIQVGLADRLGSLEGLIEELSSQTKTGARDMDITAQNVKEQYPQIAEEIAGNVKDEGKTEGKQEGQDQALALVEAILGTESKDKVKAAVDSGLTADQLKQAQQIVGTSGGEKPSGSEPSAQKVLEELQNKHGEGAGVTPGDSKSPSVSAEAEKQAEGGGKD